MKRRLSKQESSTAAKRSKPEETNLNDLPEDALHELFQRVSSLPDRFRLAGVSQKFRRCMLKEIRKTKSLSLDVTTMAWLLNGHRIPARKWPRAIKVLADRAELREIVIQGLSELSYAIYTAFVSSRPSLLKLTRFESEVRCTSPWVPSRITALLQNSPKLSALKLDLLKYELQEVKLTETLKNLALTQIDLKLKCRSEELVELFQALQPHTLKKVTLGIYSPFGVSVTKIFETLKNDSWAAVESISFVRRDNWHWADYPSWTPLPDGFFQLLAQFPFLQKCNYALDCTFNVEGLLNNVITYLKGSANSSHKRVFDSSCQSPYKTTNPGCETVPLMRGVQAAVPDVDFTLDFLDSDTGLAVVIFTSRNAVFKLAEIEYRGCYFNCAACRGFYPVVLKNLQTLAKQKTNGHLENFRLDRCKVERVVEDLNRNNGNNTPTALSAIPSADGNAVDVKFQIENDQFTIAVDTDHCFSDACIGCVVV